MKLKIKFTPFARTQFLEALTYIRADKPSAAKNFRNRVEDVLLRLEEYPESGRIIPEFPDLKFREVIVGPYRFFYYIKGRIIWVVAAWHDRQLPDDPLEYSDV